jgi:hypothetical protein
MFDQNVIRPEMCCKTRGFLGGPHSDTVVCHKRANEFSAELVPAPKSILKEAINSAETLVISVLILCYAAPKKEETSYSETSIIFLLFQH